MGQVMYLHAGIISHQPAIRTSASYPKRDRYCGRPCRRPLSQLVAVPLWHPGPCLTWLCCYVLVVVVVVVVVVIVVVVIVVVVVVVVVVIVIMVLVVVIALVV